MKGVLDGLAKKNNLLVCGLTFSKASLRTDIAPSDYCFFRSITHGLNLSRTFVITRNVKNESILGLPLKKVVLSTRSSYAARNVGKVEVCDELLICPGVISEPDLLSPPESETLEGFSDQSVILVRNPTVIPNLSPSCQILNCYTTTQTDENITKTKCPALQLLRTLLSLPQPNGSPSISTSSSNTQADLLPSTSSIEPTVSESQPSIPVTLSFVQS
ncbi:hypothetical protein TNCV_342731 [Trichonephila clavipes]|nr:hypothetical protein TNCV_342731 [Trichonephila clavipes]